MMVLGSIAVLALAFTQATPVLESVAPRWTLSQEWILGVAETGPHFTHILGLAVSPTGVAYVLDYAPPFIRAFLPSGRPLDSLGYRGDGPGEFQVPWGLGWRGDTLWVTDTRLNRVTLLPRPGTPIKVTVRRATPVGLLSDGGVLTTANAYDVTGSEGQPTQVRLTRRTRDDQITHAIAVLATGGLYTQVRFGDGGITMREPFTDIPLWKLARDGASVVVVHRPAARSADLGTFTVSRFTPMGDTVFARPYRYVPRRLDNETFDREIGRILDVPMSPRARARFRQGRAEIARALFRPPFSPLFWT